VSQAQVEEACRRIGAHSFIERLPQSYATEVGERGNRLSSGQKQLLAFARALVFDPRVLVLDEATASVDTHTEVLIQQALEVLMKGRTSITIAHRLSTVVHADKILVIRDGRLVEEGNHRQLMSQGGLYRSLVELQFKDVEAA
jgi:ABC-type multidrug transport system fused ATPase/permease subunit